MNQKSSILAEGIISRYPKLHFLVCIILGIVLIVHGFDNRSKLIALEQSLPPGEKLKLSGFISYLYDIGGANGIFLLFIAISLWSFYMAYRAYTRIKNAHATKQK